MLKTNKTTATIKAKTKNQNPKNSMAGIPVLERLRLMNLSLAAYTEKPVQIFKRRRTGLS